MLWVDTYREQHRGQFLDLGPQFLWLLVNRDGVEIHDTVDTVVVILDLGPVLQRAKIISDMRAAGGLDAGENSCFHLDSGRTSIVNDVSAPVANSVTIEKWVYGGEALARLDGRVVLAPFVLPGETVRLEA